MINANLHKYGSGLLTDISGAVCLAKNITTNYVFTIDIVHALLNLSLILA